MSAKKAKPSTKKDDKRAALAQLERDAKRAEQAAAILREKVRAEQNTTMPAVGSRWRRHPAFLYKHEPDEVATYIGFAWADAPLPQMLALLEKEGPNGPYACPLRKAIPMDTFIVEWTEART